MVRFQVRTLNSYRHGSDENTCLGHAVVQVTDGRLRVQFPTVSLGSFVDFILPDRNMALGSTQPLTEMSTRDIYREVKAAGA